MLRPVSSIQLPRLAILALRESGFIYVEDILMNEDSKKEADAILRKWGDSVCTLCRSLILSPKSETALEILQIEYGLRSIITFSEKVDVLLNGGIPLRKVTEFCGSPGTGKTQFCLQLCVSVQLPKCLGGLAGEAVYIDTDSGFSPTRLEDIAKSCSAHCEQLMLKVSEPELLKPFNVETILDGIHYIAVNSISELQRTVSILDDFIQLNRKIRLIVVDNLSFIFRYGSEVFKSRTQLICRMLSELQNLASKFNIAVVVTNHLTTHLVMLPWNGGILKNMLVPSLGVSFAHMVGLRLRLIEIQCEISKIPRNTRFLVIYQKKNVELRKSFTFFQVDKDGIRDI